MACSSEVRTVGVQPLTGSNYPTWKIQCQMALMKDGLWTIVNGTETAPEGGGMAAARAKFMARKDRALAIIVLSVDPSLLYLLRNPEDPVTVWTKLVNQFQKKTWANKLELRRKLYSLRLRDGESVQAHIKEMIEIFDGLSVMDDRISDEDRVVYLLASLPESYNMLVTALGVNADVPSMELVTERLLHEERKLGGKEEKESGDKAMSVTGRHKSKKKGPCHNCGKMGLKQSPRCWNSTLDGYLKQLGFLQSNSDPCIYIAATGELAVIGVYVDDIVVACKSEEGLKKFKQAICKRFDVKDLGKLHHFLGMKIIQDDSCDVWIGQPAYIGKVLEKYGMQDAKSANTPVDTSAKLVKAIEGDILNKAKCIQQRRRNRLSRKLNARKVALQKTTTITESEKGMWQDGLVPELMSSEESDESEEGSFKIRPLSWRSEKLTHFLMSLDRKTEKRKSKKSKVMTFQRLEGLISDRPLPTSVPAWTIKN